MKHCNRCGRYLPLEAFYGPRWGHCRECARTGSRRSSTDRYFGVEIEFVGVSRGRVAEALRAVGINATEGVYSRTNRAGEWLVKSDGSLSDDSGYTGELTSPPLRGEQGIRELRTALRVLNDLGARVNRSCGLHVHHDARRLSAAAVTRGVLAYVNRQELIDGLVAPSRRDQSNGYCRRVNDYERNELEQINLRAQAGMDAQHLRYAVRYFDRYRTVNVTAYPKHGTIEIRHHQGTTDPDKIVAWVRFGQAVLFGAEQTTSATTTEEMLDELRLDAQTRDYLKARARYFAAAPVRS